MLTEEKIISLLNKHSRYEEQFNYVHRDSFEIFASELLALQGEEKESRVCIHLDGVNCGNCNTSYFPDKCPGSCDIAEYDKNPRFVKGGGRRLTDEQLPLHQCPYSKATKCNLADPCLGCETRAEVISKTTLTDVDLREIDDSIIK